MRDEQSVVPFEISYAVRSLLAAVCVQPNRTYGDRVSPWVSHFL